MGVRRLALVSVRHEGECGDEEQSEGKEVGPHRGNNKQIVDCIYGYKELYIDFPELSDFVNELLNTVKNIEQPGFSIL